MKSIYSIDVEPSREAQKHDLLLSIRYTGTAEEIAYLLWVLREKAPFIPEIKKE